MRTGRVDLVVAGAVGGLAAMVLGGSGPVIAAAMIGSPQIADNSVRSRDVRDGGLKFQDLDPESRTALRGAPGADGLVGPDGPPGAAGAKGEPGTDGVAQVAALVGPVQSIVGNSGLYVFAGAPAQVTTTAAHGRVTGASSAPLGLTTGNPQLADVGMCFQPSVGGTLTNFYGSSFAMHSFTTTRATYAATATRALAPGTWNVGMCVRNNGSSTINNNNYVNGWVMVTS
jgi:hypothetical protein